MYQEIPALRTCSIRDVLKQKAPRLTINFFQPLRSKEKQKDIIKAYNSRFQG